MPHITVSSLFDVRNVLRARRRSSSGGEGMRDESLDHRLGAMMRRQTIRVEAWRERRIFEDLDEQGSGLRFGWLCMGRESGLFRIGVFVSRRRFIQIAVADEHGRVFFTDDLHPDTHGMDPAFALVSPDGEVTAHAARRGIGGLRPRARRSDGADGRGGFAASSPDRGVMIGKDPTGRMAWLASWTCRDGRYTLEQLRAQLPARRCEGLAYRDALTIGFVAAYLLPDMRGLLIGFGAGNIFRRLHREAPMGAIRRSVRDAVSARAHGLRVSGLEEHFVALMREVDALDPSIGLRARHGAEPLRLHTSEQTGNYFFSWDTALAFPAVLESLRIEGNLNRFAAVSAWLERNARQGIAPTEDTVTQAQAAQMDMTLLNNPALQPWKDDGDASVQDGTQPVMAMVDHARQAAQRMSERYPDPTDGHGAGCGEWVYRQTLASLVRGLRVPYRFDVEFRDDVEGGKAAIAFTSAGVAMMPTTVYDEPTRAWVHADERMRASMSARYNLRLGLMLAALAFGVDERVREVTIHIDSIGLEEIVAEQDNAMAASLQRVMRVFERARLGGADVADAKADPKDGDVHGDPSRGMMGVGDPLHDAQSDGDASSAMQERDGTDGSGELDGMDGLDGMLIDQRFADMVRGIELDSMTLALPDPQQEQHDTMSSAEATSDDHTVTSDRSVEAPRADIPDAAQTSSGEEPTMMPGNPTARKLVTVTFERDELLRRLEQDGLSHPQETYGMFDALMAYTEEGALAPIDSISDIHEAQYAPRGSQEEPELSQVELDDAAARILGTPDTFGLSIQRVDVLQRACAEFHRIAGSIDAAAHKAQQAMAIIRDIADPELDTMAQQVTGALIDGVDTPDCDDAWSQTLDRERLRARDLLFSGHMGQAVEVLSQAVQTLDERFACCNGVPRYFNSYAERVIYNRLFATVGEHTVLIPDNLFYAHMELADILMHTGDVQGALRHLNMLVSYAPSYPLSHMKLALQLARDEDWVSSSAACLNALRVALDREDAAFAYYRFAYTAWMQDRFDVAVAAYMMSEHIAPGAVAMLGAELHELRSRAESQCIPVPDTVAAAQTVLRTNDVPVWPHTQVADIVRDAARICVDRGMFVVARTLSVAAARMDDGEGIDVVQAQFLRSLNS